MTLNSFTEAWHNNFNKLSSTEQDAHIHMMSLAEKRLPNIQQEIDEVFDDLLCNCEVELDTTDRVMLSKRLIRAINQMTSENVLGTALDTTSLPFHATLKLMNNTPEDRHLVAVQVAELYAIQNESKMVGGIKPYMFGFQLSSTAKDAFSERFNLDLYEGQQQVKARVKELNIPAREAVIHTFNEVIEKASNLKAPVDEYKDRLLDSRALDF